MTAPEVTIPGSVTPSRLASARAWLTRARRVVGAPGLDAGAAARRLANLARHGLAHVDRHPGDDPAARDPEVVAVLLDAVRVLARRYFRWQVRGLDQVPPTGPALLVGNHCGGMINTEAYLTFLAIWDHLGPERAVHSLAHDILFAEPFVGDLVGRFGALRAAHGSAERAFDAGRLVLVYPGSDLDACRSWADRKRVHLGRRDGFVRLALRAQVPIVPVLAAGAHEQWVVLTRGDGLARRLDLKRWLRTEACPIVLAAPWGLTSGFLPYIPLPAQVTLAFGPPIRWPDLGPDAAQDPATVARCREEVRAAMQGLLDELYVGRRPFVG